MWQLWIQPHVICAFKVGFKGYINKVFSLQFRSWVNCTINAYWVLGFYDYIKCFLKLESRNPQAASFVMLQHQRCQSSQHHSNEHESWEVNEHMLTCHYAFLFFYQQFYGLRWTPSKQSISGSFEVKRV